MDTLDAVSKFSFCVLAHGQAKRLDAKVGETAFIEMDNKAK
jgi:hypothetical protein